MVLVHQDKDTYVAYTQASELAVVPAVYESSLMGWNLQCDGAMIGTFNSEESALAEIHCIRNCENSVYVVSEA